MDGWAQHPDRHALDEAHDSESRQRFIKELVALQPDLVLSHGTPATAAFLEQTRTIPIIFANVTDPVGSGFVASFPRPRGNVTGFVVLEPTIASKWVELLREIAPRVTRVAFLFNPVTAPYAEYYLGSFRAAVASFTSGGDRGLCSRCVRTRIHHCRTGTRV